MNKRIITVLIMSAAFHPAVFAQKKTATARDTIRTNTIEVIQSYRPEVKQAPKPVFVPDLPPADTSGSRLRYDVPVQTLYFTYHSQPLKPLALGRDTAGIPFANYVKLGGGNLSTLYLDAGIGSLHGENYETSIHLHHLSQKGNIKYQESMLSGMEANGTLHTGGHAWTAGIDAQRNRFYPYGYDHMLRPGYEPPSLVLGGVRLHAGVQNERENQAGINYQPSITASLYSGSRIEQEQQLSVQAPFSKVIDSMITVHLGISGSYTRLSTGLSEANAGIFAINPGLTFRKGVFKAHAFVSPTFGNGSNAYLLPDISLSLKIPNSQFNIYGGWKAVLNQNSYERFFLRNPFIGAPANQAASMLSQNRNDEVFGGLQSNIGKYISFSGRLSWWELRNMPLFLNNNADRSVFDLIQDPKINAVSLEANIRYQIANTFFLGLSGTWFNYYQTHVTHVWHEPGVQWKADFLIRPVPELTVTGYALVLDQIYARDMTNSAVKLKGILDLGAGAEYTIIPRLSVFLQVNNLLNSKYQRWQGYPSYGFNIFGGLRIKF